MKKNLTDLLDFMVRLCVEYNLPQNGYWGVGIVGDSALVCSGFFAVHIQNINFPELKSDENFFSFFENKFTTCTYPIPLGAILDKVYGKTEFIGKIIFPFTNVINRLDNIDLEQRKRSRLIIAPTQKEDGEINLSFTHNGSRYEFSAPGLPKGYLSQNSIIPENLIKPGVLYRCRPESDNGSEFFVNVLEESAKAKIGVLFSPSGFIPSNMEAINRMDGIPKDMITYTNAVEPVQGFNMPPIHLDATMMYDLLKAFLGTGSGYIEMHFSDNFNNPVMFKNIPNNEDDPIITIFAATLNQSFGAQRR